MLSILITPAASSGPAGKLADAEVHFTAGPLAGLKLVGFALWESQWPDRRSGQFVRVTVPSREYVGRDGASKRFDLLRPIDGEQGEALTDLRGAILEAFQEQEGHLEQATQMAREVARVAQQGPPPRPWRSEPPPARRGPQPAPRYTPPAAVTRAPAPRQAFPPQRRTASAGTSRDSGPPEPPPPGDDDYPF